MKTRILGRTGLEVSIVGLGAGRIGLPDPDRSGASYTGNPEEIDIDLGAKTVHTAVEAGCTLIDTAPLYGFGVSEQIIGKAVAGHRDEVILATKCGLIWHEQKGDFFFNADDRTITRSDHDRSVFKYLEPDSIRRELEKSLKHLGTDYIDLYYNTQE